MPPTIVDDRELSEVLNWPRDEIRDYARTGRIPFFVSGGGMLFNLDAVLAALRKHRPPLDPAAAGEVPPAPEPHKPRDRRRGAAPRTPAPDGVTATTETR